MKNKPELTPGYVDKEELEVDFRAAQDLTEVLREVQRISSSLQDTIMLTGSEAYVAALAYYYAIKGASRVNAPGAKPIYKDLKKRFIPGKRRSEEKETK